MSAGRVIARVIAVCIIVVFVVVLPALILAYNAQDVALSRGFLRSAVGDTRLYAAALDEAATGLARDAQWRFVDQNSPLARLDAPAWRRILVVVVPQYSAQAWTEEAIQVFHRSGLASGSIPERLILPFGQMRDNLVQDPDQTALHAVTQAQPPCAGGRSPLASPDALLPSCRPPDAGLEAFYQELSARWRADPQAVWGQFWPDDTGRYGEDTSLATVIQRTTGESLREVRVGWSQVSWGLTFGRLLWVLAMLTGSLLALALIAVLAARTWAEALRWIGAPIAIAGLFTLGLGLLILVGMYWPTFWPEYVSGVSATMRSAVAEVARLFGNRLFIAMAWQGALIALVGLATWASSFLLRKPKPQV
jgi:hypothetical protein